MTIDIGSAATAQIATGVAGAGWLIEADFAAPVGTLRVTTAPVNVEAGGYTYKGLGGNIQVSAINESEDLSARQITVNLPLTDESLLGQVLADVGTYRNKPLRLYWQVFDEAWRPVLSRKLRWAGRMDPVKVPRRGNTGVIQLPCSRAGMPHARNYQGLRHTHAQQQARYPGNMALQYVQDLLDKPTLWISLRFQAQQLG